MRSDLPENTRTVSIPDLKLFSDPSGGLGVTEREGIGVTERECAPSLLSFDSGQQQKSSGLMGRSSSSAMGRTLRAELPGHGRHV